MLRIIVITILFALIAGVLVLYFLPFIKKFLRRHYFLHYMGRKIYQIAHDNDYLLLQNLVLKVDNEHYAKFDHILFGNKMCIF